MDRPETIIIEDRPWGLAALLALSGVTAAAVLLVTLSDGQYIAALCAAGFLFACLYAATKAIRMGRITLYPDGMATYEVLDFQGWRSKEFPAGQLRAGVQHHRDGDGVTGRVMLLIDQDDTVTRIPFTGYFSSPEQAKDVVKQIMAWREATGAA